ncbi:hypothetical protein PV328_005611 [Microctonus aethiopoides]|uniref:Uncharacterized protein n=1 Tax=Microctonus aethiopoides TaxID=144406 RepID=A0AA39KSP0_9HYME|nr:hypothetical protein PV328_005611 [Microctonus aethiopoides]
MDMVKEIVADEADTNSETQWKISKKTCKSRCNNDNDDNHSTMENDREKTNIYEHLLLTQEDEEVESNENNIKSDNKAKPPPIYASNITIGKAIEILKNAEIQKKSNT